MNNSNLTSRIELTIKCSNLPNKDVGSHSDPLCVVKLRNVDTNKYEEVGRTERVENTLDPEFKTKILITYAFETKQDLKFSVYDCDEGTADPDDADKLGHIEISLAEVVQGRLRHGKKMQKSETKDAIIYVTARETVDCRQSYVFSFIGRGLDNKDFMGKSDPFLVFYKQLEDGSYTAVGQSEVVKDNLNPTWPPYIINCALLCDNDVKKSLKIECYDFDSDGGHDFIGSFLTTAEQLLQGIGSEEHPLINEKKKAKKSKYQNSGVIILQSYTIEEDWEFSHYIQSGLQLGIIVAIDFTASNGDPRDSRALHYFNPQYPYNQYTTAIDSVGQVVQEYDSDKLFPVFGFGGVFFGCSSTSHCHPLNNNMENPNVVGVQGILDAYRYALSQSKLSGPTNFQQVIQNATFTASQNNSGLNYFILLIITDGAITDMDRTKAAIVQASRYPMSIIIVGVGHADFSSMEELDSDKKMLTDWNGNKAERDIVQFVPLREVFGNSYDPESMVRNQHKLAKKVLAEVPKQVKTYMKHRHLRPIDIFNAYSNAYPQLNNAVPLEKSAP